MNYKITLCEYFILKSTLVEDSYNLTYWCDILKKFLDIELTSKNFRADNWSKPCLI